MLSRVLATLVIVAAGCDRFPAQDSLGVGLSRDGSLRILYAPCSGEQVREVSLVVPTDHPGGGDDTILWQIKADSSLKDGVLDVTIGDDPPPGFRSVVKLQGDLPADDLAVLVDTSKASGVTSGFRIVELTSDRFLTARNATHTKDELITAVEDRCGSG
jgi:hypothetical protein